jgi:hypothetical protein
MQNAMTPIICLKYRVSVNGLSDFDFLLLRATFQLRLQNTNQPKDQLLLHLFSCILFRKVCCLFMPAITEFVPVVLPPINGTV